MPELSFVIPTRNRADYLPLVLDGFRRQSLDQALYEIVIVDDGSTDETPELLASVEDLPLKVLRQGPSGIAAAKNLGVLASRGAIIAFADDDDMPDRDLAAAHLLAHRRRPQQDAVILGYTKLSPEVAEKPVMRHVTEIGNRLFNYHTLRPGQELPYEYFWGGRSSCKRSLLIDRGLFDPRFTFGCEDVELGYRLSQRGSVRVFYDPTAVSTMLRAFTFRGFCDRQTRQGRSQRMFARLHATPEIRKYCDIPEGPQSWRQFGHRYRQYLRWTQKLDDIANTYRERGYEIDENFEKVLHDAYSAVFALSRAKGLAWTGA